MSYDATALGSYSPSPAGRRSRTWNLALSFQEVFTAIVRLRYNRQAAASGNAFRAQMKEALQTAQQEANKQGYSSEDVRQVILAVVAFLDESVLRTRNPVFADWPRLPLQTELFGHQNAGDIVFQDLEKVLNRHDSTQVADMLEVYYLCLLLGFKGRHAAGGGDLLYTMDAIRQKIRRMRGGTGALAPAGLLPSEPVRLPDSDGIVRKLAIASVTAVIFSLVLFSAFKILLGAGASRLASFAAGIN